MTKKIIMMTASAFCAGAVMIGIHSCGSSGEKGADDSASVAVDSAAAPACDTARNLVQRMEEGDEVQAIETAEQMKTAGDDLSRDIITGDVEAARMAGRRAAKRFLRMHIGDTLKLQKELTDAYDAKRKYVSARYPDCAIAYDSAFRSTLRIVRPDIFRHLRVQQ